MSAPIALPSTIDVIHGIEGTAGRLRLWNHAQGA